MSDLTSIETKEEALDFFDSYAQGRKDEIDRRQLSKGQGLIKSYMLETGYGVNLLSGKPSVDYVFAETGWSLDSVEDSFYRLAIGGETLGFVETISSRHLAIHSVQDGKTMDTLVKKVVTETSQLDFVWLAGNYLDLLWDFMIKSQSPERFVTFKFEHKDLFEDYSWIDESDDDLEPEREETLIADQRSSTLAITMRASKIISKLGELQKILSDFKAIKMLRFPAAHLRGGYDFWDWGKITYRSPSFRDGRQYLYSVINPYQAVTELIEQRVWLEIEDFSEVRTSRLSAIKGEPVTFVFPEPLNKRTFDNFIEVTFEKCQGPFKLWGNPIYLSNNKVQVYGIDLHLWQRIFIELTPGRFIMVLPKGTCGNTVHRMVSNIQRYLSPDVETYIGAERYETLVENALIRSNYVQ
ncbi:MAG: hypothetical protein KF726_19745 [Anaerolineae bacterium]|nr:hypothetical protein [Anaerolineae bacterium]